MTVQKLLRLAGSAADAVIETLDPGDLTRLQLQEELLIVLFRFIDLAAEVNLSDSEHKIIHAILPFYYDHMRAKERWTETEMHSFLHLCNSRNMEYVNCANPYPQGSFWAVAKVLLGHVYPGAARDPASIAATITQLAMFFKILA